jgi:hypothetical protein
MMYVSWRDLSHIAPKENSADVRRREATVTALEILSLDERVRKSAKKLGLSLLPEQSP